MKVIIQRVLTASVSVNGELISSIGNGLCLLLGISKNDTVQEMEYIVNKVLNFRVFNDLNGKPWSLGVRDAGLELLCVSQFTLCYVMKGNKPDFHQAMESPQSKILFDQCIERFGQLYNPAAIKTGVFGAYMQVDIQNDGPVTMCIDSPVFPPPKERKPQGSSKQKVPSSEESSSITTIQTNDAVADKPSHQSATDDSIQIKEKLISDLESAIKASNEQTLEKN